MTSPKNGAVLSLHPKKLLHTKWTAVSPKNREKHFMVVALVEPAEEGQPVEWVEIEAVHSKRAQHIRWEDLKNASHWRQGWL